ncbi:transcriptional regulator, XRE family (plasmid) [Beijerinckia indica subsp. indica ATCC 9039]|uniref:Transcriptional regulator, XRE family n=2 Tax=Beijerinckia TaxID=532 RepID=B2ILH3_BEII9|nr:transcriptional regulator, XRE family [Beijerinckia indica subsp. indica ATCC 9039]
MELFHRLRRARKNAGFPSATEAARAFGWNANTYRSHENGERGVRMAMAERYAKAFRVSVPWLLTGMPHPDARCVACLAGRVVAQGRIETHRPGGSPLSCKNIMLPYPVPEGALVFEITGDHLWPRYESGDVVVCWKPARTLQEADGWEAAVKLADGQIYLKTVRYREGHQADLVSHNSAPLVNKHVTHAQKVFGSIRADAWSELPQADSEDGLQGDV